MVFAKLSTAASIFITIICWSGLSEGVTASDRPRSPEEQNLLGPEWKYVGETDRAEYFMNLRTIRHAGPIVKVWIFYTKSGTYGGKAYSSSKALDECDCANEQRRTTSIIRYSGKYGRGDVVFYDDGSDARWTAVTPESIGEGIWKTACGIREIHAVNPERWTRIAGDERVAFYASTTTRSHSGKIVKMMVLTDYIEPYVNENGVVSKSRKTLRLFDCMVRLTKYASQYVEYSENMGQGAIVNVGIFDEPNTAEWSAFKEDTYAESIWAFACNQK